MIGLLAAVFEPPSTKDFVFGCWGGSFKLFGFDTCFDFIVTLCVLTAIIVVTLFDFGLRRPAVVPGKFQLLADNITDAFWIRSADMREVHYVSPAFERIWGRTAPG